MCFHLHLLWVGSVCWLISSKQSITLWILTPDVSSFHILLQVNIAANLIRCSFLIIVCKLSWNGLLGSTENLYPSKWTSAFTGQNGLTNRVISHQFFFFAKFILIGQKKNYKITTLKGCNQDKKKSIPTPTHRQCQATQTHEKTSTSPIAAKRDRPPLGQQRNYNCGSPKKWTILALRPSDHQSFSAILQHVGHILLD